MKNALNSYNSKKIHEINGAYVFHVVKVERTEFNRSFYYRKPQPKGRSHQKWKTYCNLRVESIYYA